MLGLGAFLAGAVTVGYAVAALFFLRFWRRTGEGLFATLAVAFALLALNQLGAAVAGFVGEDGGWFYLLRVAAFGCIIFGIMRKNRQR
jgi:hypothetical protein